MKPIPHCDLSTGKIYGCKLGSKVWWHEKGHFEFNKLESTSRLVLFQSYAQKYWMLSITLTILLMIKVNNWMVWIFLTPCLIAFMIWWCIDIYEEIWCWIYADLKIKEKNKKYKK